MKLEELEQIILPFTTKEEEYGQFQYWFNIDEKRHPEKYGGAVCPDITYDPSSDDLITAFVISGEIFNTLGNLTVEQFRKAFDTELSSR